MPSGKTSKQRRSRSSLPASFNKHSEAFLRQAGIVFENVNDDLFTTRRTNPEQHKRALESIKMARPQLLQAIQDDIDEVLAIFKKFNKVDLLGGVAANYVRFYNDSDNDGDAERNLEYALSFATALPINPDKRPSEGIIKKLSGLLTAIRNMYDTYLISEHSEGERTEIENKMRLKAALQTLHLRGSGYTKHTIEIFTELFGRHDQFFENNYGFKAADIVQTIKLSEESFRCRCLDANGHPHIAIIERLSSWDEQTSIEEITEDSIVRFGFDNQDIIIRNGRIILHHIDDIKQFKDIYKIRFRSSVQEKVVSALSVRFGDNSNFLDPRFRGLPLNASLTAYNPFVKHGDEYYLFSFALPFRNLFGIGESLIKRANPKYHRERFLGNKYAVTRDNYLEEKAAQLLSKILPEGKFYPNVEYSLNRSNEFERTELDLLIVSEKAIYLVEMKAGSLAATSKRGALESLLGNLQDSLGYGAYQSQRALNYIQLDSNPTFLTPEGYTVHVHKASKIYRITVTLEHLAALAAHLHDLKNFGAISHNVAYAWTVNIFDLLTFSQILECENDFIDYLEKRLSLYHNKYLDIYDETDVLAYFLDDQLEFIENKTIEGTFVQLHGENSIDAYFESKGEKPIRKVRLKGY